MSCGRYIIYPQLTRVHYSFSYISTYKVLLFTYLPWIMCTYYLHKIQVKYIQSDGLIGCLAWCSKTALNLGKNWLGNLWSFMFIFFQSSFRKLRPIMGISYHNSFLLSSTHMHIFLYSLVGYHMKKIIV